MTEKNFGARIRRLEDASLLDGTSRFVSDVRLPDILHAAFVRSVHAHARLRRIDATEARAMPGVCAVLLAADVEKHLTSMRLPVGFPGPTKSVNDGPYILARDKVRYVGEPIAIVLAEDRYVAEDAALAVAVDYDPLQAVTDCRAGLNADAPRVHEEAKDNLAGKLSIGFGDVASAFANASHVIKKVIAQHKGGGHSIEGRGVVARYDAAVDQLTVWTSTQMAHQAQRILVRLLDCAEDQIRIITPDIGGGFGPKVGFYPEEALVPLAAKLMRRPVKWIEDRHEHFVSAITERDQYWDMEIACDGEGRILGVRGALLHDHGAYTARGLHLPFNAASAMPGPYIVPAYGIEIKLVFTNKPPVAAVRGAGYPQAVFAMERLLDSVARELKIDRAEIRRRNLIPVERMPYTVPLKTRAGSAVTYDTGDYPACLAKALEAGGWNEFPKRQAAAREAGRFIGIGLANYVKGTGRGPYESALVRIGPSGRVFVYTGATAQGQGTKTSLAQICADQLGVPVQRITVVAGDTGTVALGIGAFASRQGVVAGSAVHLASVEVAQKLKRVAGHMLEASESDLELSGGHVRVRGAGDVSVSFADIANAVAGASGYALPGNVEPSIEAASNFMPEKLTYANGSHVAEVEVDPETGRTTLLRYIAVDDVGSRINPMIVEGQIVGGIVHGLGNAVSELMLFDQQGQPLTTTLSDYLLPVATDLPLVRLIAHESPSKLNPLGVKGAGEAGTTGAVAAIISAIENALSPFGTEVLFSPATPSRLHDILASRRPI